MDELVTDTPAPARRLDTAAVGIFAVAFLVAFESFAVATALPVVAADLDGLALFAVSFAAPIGLAVVTMTVAGPWCDAQGPSRPFLAGLALFGAGLVVAGLAPTMDVFLVGRGLQGLGTGLVGVALYVLVARLYTDAERPAVFALLSTGWVLPAVVGPPLAGLVTELVGWRWVFLGVPLLVLVLAAVLAPSLRRAHGPADPAEATGGRVSGRRLGLGATVAGSVVLVSVAGQRSLPLWPALLALGLGAAAVAVPRLLPAGTWAGARGLPAILATRGLVFSGFFAVEAYLPLSLVEHRGLTPTQAGLVLTAPALLWATGAWASARLPALADRHRRVRIGVCLVLVSTAAGPLTLLDGVPTVALGAVWAVGGLGMGIASSTLSVLLLDASPPGRSGANSAAMQTNDAVTQALVLAGGSVVFAALLTSAPDGAYLGVFAVGVLLSAAAVPWSGRIRPG